MTPQELNALYAQKTGAIQPQQPAGSFDLQQALERARQHQKTIQAPQPVEQPGMIKRAFNALTSSEQGFGKTLGGALATSEGVSNVLGKIPGLGDSAGGAQTIADQSGIEQHNATMQKIQQLQGAGDVEGANRLRRSFGQQNLTDVEAPGIEQVIPESQKTAKQIFGEGAGVAADIASAGLFGKGAQAAKTGQLLTSSQRTAGLASRLGVPFTGVTQAIKAPLAQRVVGMAKEGAALGAAYGGSQAMQEDKSALDVFKGAAGGALLGGAIGGGLPAAGGALSKVGQGGGKLASEMLGKSTGAKSAAIREIFNNPDAIEFARRAGKNPEIVQKEVVESVVNGLKAVKEKRAVAYQTALSKLNVAPQTTAGALQTIKDKMKKIASEAGGSYSVPDNAVNLSKSHIIDGQNVMQRAFQDVAEWQDTSPVGLDGLKRRLDSYVGQLRSPDKKEAQRIVLQLKDSVRKELEEKVGGYKQMTQDYHEASDFIDELEKTFALKRGRTEEQQLNKIMQMFRPGKERSMQLAKEVQDVLGQDIVGKAAGASMGELTPKGLAGVLQPAVAFGIGNIPGLLAYLATTSPRLIAEVVSLLGRFPASAVKQKVFPQALQDALRRILIKVTNEN